MSSPLSAQPISRAPLRYRAHTLFKICSCLQSDLFVRFQQSSGLYINYEICSQCFSCGLNRERRIFSDLRRERNGANAQLILVDEFVRETKIDTLFSSEPPPGVQDQSSGLVSYCSLQRICQSEPWMGAQLDKISGEAASRCRDAEIGSHRKSKTSANGSALDGRNNRLSDAKDSLTLLIELMWIIIAADQQMRCSQSEVCGQDFNRTRSSF